MEDKTLYETEVADLKQKDRRGRIFRSINILVFEFALVIILTFFFGMLAIIAYLFALFTILPYPIFRTPSKYKITTRGVTLQDNKVISIKKDNKLQINKKGNYVSVFHPRRGEFLRLYTNELEKVHKLLSSLTLSKSPSNN